MSDKNNKSLKPGWRLLRLGDVVENINDFFDRNSDVAVRYVAGEHIDEGELRVSRYGLTSDDLVPPTFNRLFKAGDVLFHSRNIRKLAQPDFDGLTGEKLFVLRTKDQEVLMQNFLPFLLQTRRFENYVQDRWAGSTNKFLNKTPLMAYEFALPPIQQQRSILELLSSAEVCTAAYADAKRAHKILIAAFIQESFEKFDEKYEHRPCVDLMNKITVGIVVKPADLYVAHGKGVRALRSLNVVPGRFVLDEVVEISVEGHAAHQKSALSAGDIVIVRTGRPGDAAVVTPDLANTNCIDLILAKPGPLINAEYVVAFLNSQFGRRLFSSGTTGTAQQHFNVGEFSKLKLPVPPLTLQSEFVSRLSEFLAPAQALDKRLRDSRTTKEMVLSSSICGA